MGRRSPKGGTITPQRGEAVVGLLAQTAFTRTENNRRAAALPEKQVLSFAISGRSAGEARPCKAAPENRGHLASVARPQKAVSEVQLPLPARPATIIFSV